MSVTAEFLPEYFSQLQYERRSCPDRKLLYQSTGLVDK